MLYKSYIRNMNTDKKIAALFDLDGVLIDSESIYTQFWDRMDALYPTGVANFSYAIKGTTLPRILDTYFPDPEVQAKLRVHLREQEDNMVYRIFPGVTDFLKALRAEGIPTAIVTSSNNDKMHALFAQLPGFRELFDVVVTDSDVHRSKPDPEGYQLAAQRLGVPSGQSAVRPWPLAHPRRHCRPRRRRHRFFQGLHSRAAALALRMTNDLKFSSVLLENAVTELSRLPGIGRKTALRLALHLLRREPREASALGRAIIDMREGIRYCRVCHNISQDDVCPICSSAARDTRTVCVVENVKDVMSIENTGEYRGLYHVLGGLISPIDGIGPDVLEIASLVERIAAGGIDEVILALSATMEGDTTNFYIYRRLGQFPDLRVTQLARGVSIGNEIEYTDEITLGPALLNRTPFSDSFAG